MIVAKVFCNRCHRDGTWTDNNHRRCAICGDRGRIFRFHGAYTENPLKDFVEFLKGLDKKFDSYVFSHYGGRYVRYLTLRENVVSVFRYDIILMSGEYQRQGGYQLSFIRTGHKIFQMIVQSKNKSPKTVFRDSFNLFPFALADLPKAFDLFVQDKGWFPHHYNRAQNMFVRLPHLPAKEFYGYNAMKPSKQVLFDKWYQEN